MYSSKCTVRSSFRPAALANTQITQTEDMLIWFMSPAQLTVVFLNNTTAISLWLTCLTPCVLHLTSANECSRGCCQLTGCLLCRSCEWLRRHDVKMFLKAFFILAVWELYVTILIIKDGQVLFDAWVSVRIQGSFPHKQEPLLITGDSINSATRLQGLRVLSLCPTLTL